MRFYNRQHRHYCGIDLHMLARGTVFSMEKFLHA
jgi:hypothetical protein